MRTRSPGRSPTTPRRSCIPRIWHASEQVALLKSQLAGIAGLALEPMCFTMDERFIVEPVNCLVLRFEPASRSSPAALARALADGNPSILAVEEPDKLAIVM